MKEMNINIEGYNVSGVCVGCLNYNRKMFHDEDVKKCYKFISDIHVPDGLSIQVCWECLAAVKNVIRFQDQVLHSYDILIGYSHQNPFLKCPEDLTRHATTRLAIARLSTVDSMEVATSDSSELVTEEQKIEIEVKVDIKQENVLLESETTGDPLEFESKPVKEEPQFPEDSSDYFQSHDQDVDNDSSEKDTKVSLKKNIKVLTKKEVDDITKKVVVVTKKEKEVLTKNDIKVKRTRKKRVNRVKKKIKREKAQANIDVEVRKNIIKMHTEGHNISEIADELGLSRNTVSRWVRRYKEEGSLASRERSGRPSIINISQRQYMVNESKKIGFIPTKQFSEIFDISMPTIRRALIAEGLPDRKPAKRPYLKETHKLERIRFAREFLDFNWESTIFSNEKIIKSYHKIRRECDKKKVPKSQEKITVSVWGWMSADGPGELEFVPPYANSSIYVDVLNDIMLPTVRNVYPSEDVHEITFVQDNTPIQRASNVRDWFSQHPEINVIPWPARSTDLNPIEIIWSLMMQRWHDETCLSPEQLKSHCVDIWEHVRGTEICANIVGSMRQRLLKCIENKGGLTKI